MLQPLYINQLSKISRTFRYANPLRVLSKSHRWTTRQAEFRNSSSAILSTVESPPDALDPFEHTAGRWLYRDSLERDARRIKFDLHALRKRVVELCPGATSVVKTVKHEGGFNRVFVFTCDNAKSIVARLPFRLAGPARLTTNSEVATIMYIQANTSIPIPKILDWSDDPSNAIGSEYIIMEHARGVQLHQRWPSIAGDKQITCIENIFTNVEQIAAIDFPAFGSLYFTDGPLPASSSLPLTQRFCIGPNCRTRYWDCNVGERRYYNLVKHNKGPWSSLTEYCDALIDTGLSRLPSSDVDLADKPSYQGSIATHISLLHTGRSVIQQLIKDPRVREAANPTLCHTDLHKRNIFVSDEDPTVITDIIDWQSSSIEPAFEYADDIPDFATPLSDDSPQGPNAVKQASLCSQAHDVCVKGLMPKLSAARALDNSLLLPIKYSHRTWRDGAVVFRHELITIALHWAQLGLPGPCPYKLPTVVDSAEMLEHEKEFKRLYFANNLRWKLIDLLDVESDAWVPAEVWEETRKTHREFWRDILEGLRNAGGDDHDEDIPMDEAELRRVWPFDIDE